MRIPEQKIEQTILLVMKNGSIFTYHIRVIAARNYDREEVVTLPTSLSNDLNLPHRPRSVITAMMIQQGPPRLVKFQACLRSSSVERWFEH